MRYPSLLAYRLSLLPVGVGFMSRVVKESRPSLTAKNGAAGKGGNLPPQLHRYLGHSMEIEFLSTEWQAHTHSHSDFLAQINLAVIYLG